MNIQHCPSSWPINILHPQLASISWIVSLEEFSKEVSQLVLFSRQCLSLSTFRLLHHCLRAISLLLLLHMDLDIGVAVGPCAPTLVALATWMNAQKHDRPSTFLVSPLIRATTYWIATFVSGSFLVASTKDVTISRMRVWSLASVISTPAPWFYNPLGFHRWNY